MSVFVVRAFVQMRDLLGGTKELARQLADLEKKLTARLDVHDSLIVDVLRRVMEILESAAAAARTAETADWFSCRAGRQTGQQGKEKA